MEPTNENTTETKAVATGDLLAEVINLRQTVENHECALKAMDDVNAGLRLACEDWIKIANSGANKLNAKVRENDTLRRIVEQAVKHRGHVAGEVALDKLAAILATDDPLMPGITDAEQAFYDEIRDDR